MIALYTIKDRPGEHEHVGSWVRRTESRCTYCGHRVNAARQTREEPWRIPHEIVFRFLAMRRGKQAR